MTRNAVRTRARAVVSAFTRNLARLLAFAGAVFGAAGVSAQVLQAPFNASYTLHDLGSVAGVPTNYGGLFILPGQPNTLYLGGSANRSTGGLYAVPIVRDSNGL